MPVTGSAGAAVQSSGISHPISLNYASGAISISQPLNCEIPCPTAQRGGGGGGESLEEIHHHHLHHHPLYSDEYFHSQQPNYPQTLLTVVTQTAAPPQSNRMTTDLSDWVVDTPSKGSILDDSMISPVPTGDATSATQITPSTASSSSSTNDCPQQELWWTEGLVMQAQQEYPGELGEKKKKEENLKFWTRFINDSFLSSHWQSVLPLLCPADALALE